MMTTASRHHDFSYGHRVYGHESKCACLHGHNGRVTFHCEATELDSVGRVIDFGVIKATLCDWIEHNWDHKFLFSDADPVGKLLLNAIGHVDQLGITQVPFNPTAENLAAYLLNVVGPNLLQMSGVTLVRVDFEETRKCGVTVTL